MAKAAKVAEVIPPAAKTAKPKKTALAVVEVDRPDLRAPLDTLATLERLMSNKDIVPEQLAAVANTLLAMEERLMDRSARAAFDRAMTAMQPDLPVVSRKGKIEVRAKDAKGERTGNIIQSTAFAKWEDIDEALKPILNKHGFGLTFRTDQTAEGKLIVIGILSHNGGWREQTSLALMYDTTGSKNNVQAVGSSLSYGKRYVAGALLNFTTRGEDDDGAKGGGGPVVPGTTMSQEQVDQLIELCEATDLPKEKLVERMNRYKPKGHPDATGIAVLPAERFDEAVAAIRVYEAAVKERAEGAKVVK